MDRDIFECCTLIGLSILTSSIRAVPIHMQCPIDHVLFNHLISPSQWDPYHVQRLCPKSSPAFVNHAIASTSTSVVTQVKPGAMNISFSTAAS